MPLDTLHDGIVAALHRADRRIWIATPYFVPSEPMAQALCTAARRGVEVLIFLPDRSNSPGLFSLTSVWTNCSATRA